MRRRRRRGGANCARALNARKVLKLEGVGLASVDLETVGQLHLQAETCTNWHFNRRQDNDEAKVIRRRRTWKSKQGVKSDHKPHVNVLPSTNKSRSRNTRFSNIENMTLVSKLVPVYEQLLGKCKSRTPLLKKSQMWQEICDAVNSAGNKQRFVHNCKKRFNDIRRQLRNKLNREKSLLGDHARPSAFRVYYTQYEEELKKVLPAEVIDGIEFFDSEYPQELWPEEEAGPSWCTLENSQKLLMREKSSRELQNISEPEELQTPLCIGLLDEQWSMFSDPSSIFPVTSNTVRSMDFSTDHMDLQLGQQPVDPMNPKFHPSPRSTEKPSFHNVPAQTSNGGPRLLKVLKATQKLFRKGMMHSLDVLHSDVNHLNKCIDESHSIAYNLLRVEGERNSILHRMNTQLGKLSESIEQLAHQQQAEKFLLNDFPRRPNPRSRSPYPSLGRGGRIGGRQQAGGARHSLRVTSSATSCFTEPGFMVCSHQNNVI